MQIKHYKDSDNKLYGIAVGKPVPAGLQEISVAEAEQIGISNYARQKEQELAGMDYYRQRLMSYPELGEFIDAWVKKDDAALEEYRQKCLAVKAKYPKPPGF